MGIFAKYKPPHANYMIGDYPVLVNLLPELNRAANDEFLGRIAGEYATMIEEVLDRYSGELETSADRAKAPLRNPLIWFREGVEACLAVPRTILAAFGVVRRSGRHPQGKVAMVTSGLFALVTFVSGLVTIVAGWDPFRAIIGRVLRVIAP